VRTHFKIR